MSKEQNGRRLGIILTIVMMAILMGAEACSATSPATVSSTTALVSTTGRPETTSSSTGSASSSTSSSTGASLPTSTSSPASSSSSTTQAPPATEPRQRFGAAAWTRGDLVSLAHAVNAGAVSEVDTDWWHVRSDGSLAPDAIANPQYVMRALVAGLRVFATITNRPSNDKPFDPALAEAVLASPESRAHFAGLLVDLCDQQHYHGIDIDFESLEQAQRDEFSAFMATLAQQLHADGKRLSVAVYDKQTEYPTGPEAGARAAEDYKALGAVVDEFKVLTFGEHGSFTGPGPISSPEWTSRVLAYAESQVDPAKIRMGVPFFGFDWGTGTPRYLTWSAAQRLISQYKPAIKRSASGEPYFQYTASGVRHTVYFQDKTSIEGKVKFALAQKPAIAGIAVWVMGIEGPGFWQAIGGLVP